MSCMRPGELRCWGIIIKGEDIFPVTVCDKNMNLRKTWFLKEYIYKHLGMIGLTSTLYFLRTGLISGGMGINRPFLFLTQSGTAGSSLPSPYNK
jgi:hypothetical protein